jgi:N-acetylglutamate synthase-like GNAT family acetyltransferase
MIRRCREQDFDTIEAVVNEAASAYRGAIPDDCWHEPYMSAEALGREIDAGVEFWGWYEAGELIGAMGIQDVRDVTLIRHAYVRTARQRGGIGAQLLEFLVNRATRPVLVGTWAAAAWAVHFYQRHGFHLVPDAEKDFLLSQYWSVSPRQRDVSVVLRHQKP